eukprot:scaffold93178_cov63-Phaeocystis_antarctica.AAC.1
MEQLHLAQQNKKHNRVSFAQPIGADRTKMAFVRFGRLGAGHLTSKSCPSQQAPVRRLEGGLRGAAAAQRARRAGDVCAQSRAFDQPQGADPPHRRWHRKCVWRGAIVAGEDRAVGGPGAWRGPTAAGHAQAAQAFAETAPNAAAADLALTKTAARSTAGVLQRREVSSAIELL